MKNYYTIPITIIKTPFFLLGGVCLGHKMAMFLPRPVAGNHESERWERRVGVMIEDWDFHGKEQLKMISVDRMV